MWTETLRHVDVFHIKRFRDESRHVAFGISIFVGKVLPERLPRSSDRICVVIISVECIETEAAKLQILDTWMNGKE